MGSPLFLTDLLTDHEPVRFMGRVKEVLSWKGAESQYKEKFLETICGGAIGLNQSKRQ